jgi:cytochrome c oxidase assembly protein subunit 15
MKNTLYYKLSLFAMMFAAVVVLLGAYTRLVDAGLGCPDWPGCYGFLSVPESADEVKLAEQAYPHAPVEAEKAWPEMIHRYFAGALGLIIALLAFLAIKARKDPSQPLVLPLILLALVIFQAALGMWTVTMGLLPVVVMGHLLGGFTTLALLWLLFLRLGDGNRKATPNRLRTLTILGIIIVFLQISLGGWTTANYAAIICADFPTCQGHWIPPLDMQGAFQIRGEGVNNYLGGFMDNDARVTIHWMHRVGALITTLYLIFLSYSLAMQDRHKYASWIIAVLTVQVTLGISNVLLSLPLHVAVAHNGIAALLLLSLVAIARNLGQQTEVS